MTHRFLAEEFMMTRKEEIVAVVLFVVVAAAAGDDIGERMMFGNLNQITFSGLELVLGERLKEHKPSQCLVESSRD